MIKNEKRSFELSKEHLANERTFLAWIRTCMGVMIFGFVVEKFSFFLREIIFYLNKEKVPDANQLTLNKIGYASHFGIFLVAIGALMGLFAFLSYRQIGRQLEKSSYQPTLFLPGILTILVCLSGAFLVLYLIFS